MWQKTENNLKKLLEKDVSTLQQYLVQNILFDCFVFRGSKTEISRAWWLF